MINVKFSLAVYIYNYLRLLVLLTKVRSPFVLSPSSVKGRSGKSGAAKLNYLFLSSRSAN